MSLCSRLLSSVAIMAILATSALAAHADTIDFSYTGTSAIDGFPGTVTGNGSFTFSGTPSSLNLASLTGFSFTDAFNFGVGETASYTYSLGDLTSFSASLTGDSVTALALQTNGVAANNPNPAGFDPESFTVSFLGPNGASTMGDGMTTTAGQVTPEPSSLALLGTGILALAGLARRRYLPV